MMHSKGLSRKLAAVAVALGISGAALAEPQLVAVTAIVEHPALDAVRDGIREQLKLPANILATNRRSSSPLPRPRRKPWSPPPKPSPWSTRR